MELHLIKREHLGKKSNLLRKEGKIPGEIYGHGTKNIHVTADGKEFMKIYRKAGGNTVVMLHIEKEIFPALIAEVQMNHRLGTAYSIDFLAVKKNEKIRIGVPIVLTGEAPAKRNGFDVLQTLTILEVETLPSNIPHEFTIDISKLENSETDIAVKDISLPKDVRILTPIETVIVAVTEKQKEEEETPPPPIDTDTENSEIESKKE